MLQASGHDLRILSNLSTYLRLPIGWYRAVVWSIDITHPRIIDFIMMAFQKPPPPVGLTMIRSSLFLIAPRKVTGFFMSEPSSSHNWMDYLAYLKNNQKKNPAIMIRTIIRISLGRLILSVILFFIFFPGKFFFAKEGFTPCPQCIEC